MAFQPSDANPAESSTAEATEVPAAAPAEVVEAPDANAAASSTVDEGAKPVDLLSVVKDAVKKEEPAAAASPAAEGEGEAQPGEAEAKAATTAEEQAEADKKLPFHEHPRWKEVIAERDNLRDDATSFREISGFMRQHGLTGDEVTEGFDIMAKLKSGTPANLAEAREFFASRLAFLDDALGNVLPEDLRQRVEGGEIDEDAAKEVARLRAAEKLRTVEDERRQTADSEARTRETAVANATACATAVDDWEKQQKAADPDYAKKAALVETTCRAIVHETGKPPRNPEEAVALAKKAYARVTEQLSAALPKPKPVNRNPQGSSAKVVNEPKSLLEAVKASLER